MFFFQRNLSPLLFISCSCSFSVVHISVDVKIESKKRLGFVAVFCLQMSRWTCDFFKATKLGSCDKHPEYCLGLNVNMCLCAIFHYRNERGTGAEMYPAVVSGIVTGDAPISYWPIFFSLPLVTVNQNSLAKLTQPSFFSYF